MIIPPDKQTWEGEIATYWFEGNILVALSKNPVRTVENITRNVALVQKITSNNRVQLLIYLSNSPMPYIATRKYAVMQLPVVYKAMAMVSNPVFQNLE